MRWVWLADGDFSRRRCNDPPSHLYEGTAMSRDGLMVESVDQAAVLLKPIPPPMW